MECAAKGAFEDAMQSTSVSPKILLIDDDYNYGQLLKALASREQLHLEFYDSLLSLGSIARLGEFDLIISDYFLEYIKGLDIATYVNHFFSDTPVIIISADPSVVTQSKQWPKCVKGILPKSYAGWDILAMALNIYYEEKGLQ